MSLYCSYDVIIVSSRGGSQVVQFVTGMLQTVHYSLARGHDHVSLLEINENVTQLSMFTCSWKLQCGGYFREMESGLCTFISNAATHKK